MGCGVGNGPTPAVFGRHPSREGIFLGGSKGELRGAHSQTNFILIYTFFHKIALLDVITAMRSFHEFTNNFSPSS